MTYSDRFIPSRAVSARLDFSILDREAAASETPHRAAEKEESSGAYNMLLRSELLGCPTGPLSSPEKGGGGAAGLLASSPTKRWVLRPGALLLQRGCARKTERLPALPPSPPIPSPPRPACSPSRKMFRYIAGDQATPTAGLPTQSPYARGLLGDDSTTSALLASPTRLLRKIPRSPFKVLDAPALADDFYLNLVDWSAANVLAVGLGSCVYLWSACTSKVTRLVDFGTAGAVCSVAWSQRGTYLSVGTDKGEVQIWDATKCKR